MTDEQDQYELIERFGDTSVELKASGLGGSKWARIVHAIHAELSKPDFILELPDGLSAEEVEGIRQRWVESRT